MKKHLFSLIFAISFFVSCGNPSKIEFNPINSNPAFQDKIDLKKDPYILALSDPNYSYSNFKNKFTEIFQEIKSKNNDEFPFACDNGAKNCLTDEEITYEVIRKLVSKKILNFLPNADLPLPENLPKVQVSYIKMNHKFSDQEKKLELKLEFGHFHSSQAHVVGSQIFSLNFKAD
ncbi:Uncharacterised protein [Mesomycoplasma dispar]|uniref:Lipoprotein n=1 Tax=Mesomycoplasma dispar TaxID=86660 RepID=A0AAJ5TCW8_9BACT|nr:hypothetical protein [Mesomycoplasma dispar]AJR12219.1 hypothetical protein MDIS_02140 [Mesomycoplasma dispar]ATP59699.1 hypothetical protein CSW10_02000 [Mesomycoplasma dispar]VEU61826.1 Uncharacterised protein [Mesomycoplasma dispar]